MYIDLKAIRGKKYQEFIRSYLKRIQYIIVTTMEPDEGILPLSKSETSVPIKINYQDILLADYEHICFYENRYYETSALFGQYDSIKDFLDLNNIYRLMFATETEVVVLCMYEGITVY